MIEIPSEKISFLIYKDMQQDFDKMALHFKNNYQYKNLTKEQKESLVLKQYGLIMACSLAFNSSNFILCEEFQNQMEGFTLGIWSSIERTYIRDIKEWKNRKEKEEKRREYLRKAKEKERDLSTSVNSSQQVSTSVNNSSINYNSNFQDKVKAKANVKGKEKAKEKEREKGKEKVEPDAHSAPLSLSVLKFKKAFPNKSIEGIDIVPKNIDIDLLIKSIEESKFLTTNKNLDFQWCINQYQRIIGDRYKDYINQLDKKEFKGRNYTTEDMNAFFDDIDKVVV